MKARRFAPGFFMRYNFPKIEHLVRKEHFDALHEHGAFIKAFPFSLRYMEMPLEDAVQRKVAIIAPKKGLKKAIDRNRTKRQMRELYRLHKEEVYDSGKQEIWSLRYLGNRTNDYAFLEGGYKKLLMAYEEQRKKEVSHEK